ncbi:MAG: biotin carboxylase N-terminal domain-containing protein [Lautropia sp.]
MKRVLIANRGEIACRVVRSCRRLGLESVAVYSDADADAMHTAVADHRHGIGGASPAESYLRVDALLEAAHATGADSVHPGYGFLAENAPFARAVQSAGLVWIGPSPDTIMAMGDKERARSLAAAAGVPVLPGSRRFGPDDVEGLTEAAARVGFPLLVKASAGGGGIGMRRVEKPEDLPAAVEATQSMALRAFGDGAVYLERFISEARHVEVQVFGFGDGSAIHLHERDCSIQRRFQKIIEESPAPGLEGEVRKRMCDAAVALCFQERYQGAGTVEFVVDVRTQEFYFLEMNTRIQVEHPVTEMVTGVDLVGMQLQLAAGQALEVRTQSDVSARGHAIECRLYAERPAKNFLPSTGVLSRLVLPETDQTLRIDLGVRQGDRITHYYDPMIAKLIVHASTRSEAIQRMLKALASVEIEGVETNLAFLRRTVDHRSFRAGDVGTAFVHRHASDLVPPVPRR